MTARIPGYLNIWLMWIEPSALDSEAPATLSTSKLNSVHAVSFCYVYGVGEARLQARRSGGKAGALELCNMRESSRPLPRRLTWLCGARSQAQGARAARQGQGRAADAAEGAEDGAGRPARGQGHRRRPQQAVKDVRSLLRTRFSLIAKKHCCPKFFCPNIAETR